ncbi:unnamed protein product [Hermetia illucens]|uniref:Kinesin motor domain-containing protein n=2 Tax=Hermetia illucens TaxID=343691 RepID=A0A7R8UG98_HERIL|nr:unnamed protein product [Hermetia illucens]
MLDDDYIPSSKDEYDDSFNKASISGEQLRKENKLSSQFMAYSLSVAMDKRSMSRLNRRRPPNLNLKTQSTRYTEPQDPDGNRENEHTNVIPPSVPVFASVHRPRHASISAIKRDNPSGSGGQHQQLLCEAQSQSPLRGEQQHQNQHELGQQSRPVFRANGIHSNIPGTSDFQRPGVILESGDNGNSNVPLTGVESAISKGTSRSVEPAAVSIKQSWQGIHHHHGSHHSNYQQHHSPIAVAIPQPFYHQNQQQSGVTSGESANGSSGITGSSHPHLPGSGQTQPVVVSTAHQLQATTAAESRSRIPMSNAQQQNFNQISKTATNLLNDIYEKHLLSQTTFQNVSLPNNRPPMLPNGFVVLPALNMTSTANPSFIAENGQGSTPSAEQLSNLLHLQQRHQLQQKMHHLQHVQGQPVPNGFNSVSLVTSVKHQQLRVPLSANTPNHHQNHQQMHHHNHQQPNHHTFYQVIGREGPPPEPSQHLYEIVNPPPLPATSTPNRIPRKRTPGRIVRKSSSSGGEENGKQSAQLLTTRKQAVGDENYCREPHHQRQPNRQQQPTPPQHGLHAQHSRLVYNPQPRTRADGENYPDNPSSSKQRSANVNTSGSSLHPMQNTASMLLPPPAPFNTPQVVVQNPDIVANERPANLKLGGIPVANNVEVTSKPPPPPPPSGLSSIRESCGVADGDISRSEFEEFNGRGGPHRKSGSTKTTVAKYQYRNSKIDLMVETAQAVAAAEYYARAAQKLAQSETSKSRSTEMTNASRNGGFCGALQRAPPPIPAGLARRFANKENYGIGRVKVMLRVSDSPSVTDDDARPHFMTVDKKKRQVTLSDPTTCTAVASTSQERGPMVAAPKMFAFDGLFTTEDLQSDICASALSEVIPAVLEGSDGCLLTIGYPNSGQSRTMLGSVTQPNDLGAIPCAIAWLYKGINERRQKSGSRFSVRVSALGVSATKPDSSSKDLLAAHATESDDSPGVYLREDFLGGPTELRAPTAERAALFLDAALAGRPQSSLEPAMIFTLHVYQYSLSRKGGVAGGRSRLHLIDLGGCANRNGGLPLSGIGNILLAILSGQRHPPNKDHPLTPLLKDCLAPLDCHVTILAHVSHSQTHTDALTTIQLASRIHRMRRRKHRFPISADKTLGLAAGHQSGGSSEGPDPSSSDLSADTVIYMGPCDDATDGEHPPVYLPSLSSGDNRCAMNKVLKGACVDGKSSSSSSSKIPAKKGGATKPQSPVVTHRTDSLKRSNVPSPVNTADIQPPLFGSGPISQKSISASSSPKMVSGVMRHPGINKGSNVPTPKGSPLRRPNVGGSNPESPLRQISEEQWIDGPRVSRSKVAEARHLLREINHVKQCETWIDGPKSASSKPLTVANLPNSAQQANGYGFMDSHKKTMIRQWVENQSSHVMQSMTVSPSHQTHHVQQQQQQQQQQLQQQLRTMTYQLTQFNKQKSEDDQHSMGSHAEMINPIGPGLLNNTFNASNAVESSVRSGLLKLGSGNSNREETDIHSEKSGISAQIAQNCQDGLDMPEEEDQDSGPSEVPPALPLIEPLGSREISHESLHRIISRHVSRESLSVTQHNIQTIDCGLQVTEEEIAKTMGCEHPLAALSHGDVSVVSSFNIGDAFSDCALGERTRNQFDQLARLREIFTSQLAMAEVTPTFRIHDAGSVYSEPAFRFNAGPGSVCSEPAYRPPSPRQSLIPSRTPSQTSLPSLNGIMQIAGMEQYASLRHPDGASDPNLPKLEKQGNSDEHDEEEVNEKSELLSKLATETTPIVSQNQISQLPLLPLTTSEAAYDSGHDSSTPRTSKHSGISRRAESGYHSVATARDSDESSFMSGISKEHHNRITMKKKRQDKSLCNWLRNPFTCTYPETEGEISDF